MVQTIGNPLTWGAQAVAGGSRTVEEAVTHLGSDARVSPRVHSLHGEHILLALQLGVSDMLRFRSDVPMLVAVYPLIGILLVTFAFNMDLLPALFPMAAGFALLGPVAAVGLYALSKLHEAGEPATWGAALRELGAGTIGPVIALGAYLLVLFVLWMAAAMGVYAATLGPDMPTGLAAFASDVMTTSRGWTMIWLGCGIGGVFAVLVLVTAFVSFPMLVDRPVGLPTAVATSVRVALKNPLTTALWGLTVAVALVLASLPLFLGLILALPILGHATWHLYRMAVSFD